jgi:hypothetical protein
VFALLLLGHVLGDFYLQWDKLAEQKRKNIGWLFLHGAIYTACIAASLLIGVGCDPGFIPALLFAGVSHLAVDYVKVKGYFKCKPFITDQIIHFALLLLVWFWWGRSMTVKDIIIFRPVSFPDDWLEVILGMLILWKPIGLLISSKEIWDFNKNNELNKEAQKGAGKMTGYLERTIVYLLLLYGQYSAFTFVIAAKSVLRFPEISGAQEKRALAEYYLIGTLMSMTSVFVTSVLLGLVG